MVIEFQTKKARLSPRRPEIDISPSATVILTRDGTQICAILGPDLETGISGFGDTVLDALRDLVGQMECEKLRLDGVDF